MTVLLSMHILAVPTGRFGAIHRYFTVFGVIKYVNAWHPAEYAVKAGVQYNKAQTATTETPPYSPPANRELSDCSSVAPYLSRAHLGYMMLKG